MKRFASAFLTALLAIVLVVSPVLASEVKTATDTINGIEISAGIIIGSVRYGATFVGLARGDLPGAMTASVNYTPNSPVPGSSNTIIGGCWHLDVVKDGKFLGRILGRVTGGQIAWQDGTNLGNVTAVLTVTGGTERFSNVTGTGVFSGVLSHLVFPPAIRGVLNLSYSR